MSKEEHKRTEGARTKASTAGTVTQSGKIGGAWKFQKQPAFLGERIAVWDELFAKQVEVYKGFPHEPIKVTLPDGAVKEGISFETSPFSIASAISSQLAKQIIVSRVKYVGKRVATLDEGLLNPEAEKDVSEEDQWFMWDVNRPLEGDCDLQLIKFGDEVGKETFWHSSAHVLGETLENEYGVQLCHGPPTDSGFFYDTYSGSDIFTEKNYKDIEKAAKKIVADAQTFNRLVLTKEESLRLFSSNPFKVSMISSKIPDGGRVTAYRCGNLIDLCTGPHIPSTKIIKAFKVMKNSSAYWLGKANNDSLQRVYGITFPSDKEMKEYVHLMEEAAKRDHRTLGKQQGLFSWHELSPGSAFMQPKGTHIYNELVKLIKAQYRVRGYSEVISPNIFNLKLWKTSGHYVNYKENMFIIKDDVTSQGMKPMNCPAHALMFANEQRAYRDLPIRFADFGVLHRNELSGALSGLTRVRRFAQDDAHIFCREDQIMEEIGNTLDFLDHIYGLFGFKFELELSTRPEKRLGSEKLWDQAEKALEDALNRFGKPWKINPNDGAFYGPKIDIKVYDALKRAHQCGTIQLDFQNPIRFNLQYRSDAVVTAEDNQHLKPTKHVEHLHVHKKMESKHSDDEEKGEHHEHTGKGNVMDSGVQMGKQVFKADEYDCEDFVWVEQHKRPGFERPVMVHRAILGSVERFMAILIEHLGGKWPFFLSPRQAVIFPIAEKYMPYCESVYLYLHRLGWQVQLDRSSNTLNKKVRTNQLDQWNFILVAGEKEATEGTIDIRTRENKRLGTKRIDELHEYFTSLLPVQSKKYEQFYEKAWNPANFAVGCCGGAEKAQKEKCKLICGDSKAMMVQMVQVVADICEVDMSIEITTEKSKAPNGRFPYLETADGTIIFEVEAVSKHIARMSPASNLLGKSLFAEAQVNQWISWCQSTWLKAIHPPLFGVYGIGKPIAPADFSAGIKDMKVAAKTFDTHLKGKQWIAGDSISLADLYCGACFAASFQTVLDAGFRKAMPNLAAWFERWSQHQPVVRRHGRIQACQKALKPASGGPPSPESAAPAKKEEKPADDDLDLFGDDDEDTAAAAAEAKANAAAAKAKKPKKVVIAMSLVMLEVKPLDDTTDLDELAKHIFATVTQDGLFWKTEYKKEPVAFGIFKLIVGFSLEDEKVSVDNVVERIESIEDRVQSVEIAVFNKI